MIQAEITSMSAETGAKVLVGPLSTHLLTPALPVNE